MTKFYSFVITILSLISINFAQAVEPTFDVTIRNVSVETNPVTGADSLLTFDVYFLWTNPGVSDPFEFCFSDGAVFINHDVFNGGVVYGLNSAGSFSKILNSSDIPTTNDVATRITAFDSERDLLQWNCATRSPALNYTISHNSPGTKFFTFKLRTNSHSWSAVFLGLKFKLYSSPETSMGYFPPSLDPDDPDHQFGFELTDTLLNHFTVESDFPLPVELQSFTSRVNRNIVTLNWTTSSEINNHGFEIQRKTVGSNEWNIAGYVNGNGTTQSNRNYNFTERLPAGQYNYRLKQIDYNSNYNYFRLTNDVVISRPGQYRLAQNFPNPFNPSTKIDYELIDDASVSIVLYDMTGREISQLLNESKTAGLYTIEFNASELPSGIYFYKMTATGTDLNFTEIKKMTLVK